MTVPTLVPTKLAEGAKLFNEASYWHAHEAWEAAWLALKDAAQPDAADLVQGLILATAALENLRRGKRGGFAVQGAKSLLRLERYATHGNALGLADLDAFTHGWREFFLTVMADRRVTSLDDVSLAVPRLDVTP